jgi:hypothetical protein
MTVCAEDNHRIEEKHREGRANLARLEGMKAGRVLELKSWFRD